MSEIDQAVHELPVGNVAFNTPTSMVRGKSATVKLVVSLHGSLAQVKERVAKAGRTVGAHAHLSDEMKATLTGIGFKIAPAQSPVQLVGRDRPTAWQWQVEAMQNGTLTLNLDLSALIRVGHASHFTNARTFERTWAVNVSFGARVETFLEGNWQWLWAAVLVPGAGGAWRLLRRRRG